MSFLANRRVLVTGGGGFLGSFIVDKLRERKPASVFVPRSAEYDLRDRSAVARCLRDARPDVIIHAAAIVGGIGANRSHPGKFFYDNAIMGIQLIEEARRVGIQKFVALGTICAYPKFAPTPFREEKLWDGYPEETNAPYGLAKKMLLVQLQAYREEYGFNGIYLLPVNLYGPRDNFDLESGHVIPSMIRRFIEARDSAAKEVTLWGDGSPTREFLYVEDAAEGVLAAAERCEETEPINLGSGAEISIRDLADLISRKTGFGGTIRWDTSRPNGQPRRQLDTSRALARFGWKATTPLEEGLDLSVNWYLQSRSMRVGSSL
jgi:GDP-L-fucose synthase